MSDDSILPPPSLTGITVLSRSLTLTPTDRSKTTMDTYHRFVRISTQITDVIVTLVCRPAVRSTPESTLGHRRRIYSCTHSIVSPWWLYVFSNDSYSFGLLGIGPNTYLLLKAAMKIHIGVYHQFTSITYIVKVQTYLARLSTILCMLCRQCSLGL